MKAWKPRRASVYEAGFQEQIKALGFDVWLWDQTAPMIDEVLCGAELEHLNHVYPPNTAGLRLLLSERSKGLPPLRIAFRIDELPNGEDVIVYVAVSLRAPEMCRAVESKRSMIVKVGARW